MRLYVIIALLALFLLTSYAIGQELTTTEYTLVNGLRAIEQMPLIGPAAAWGIKIVTSIVMMMTALTTIVRPIRAGWCFLAQGYPGSRILAAGCPHLSRLYCVFGYFSAYNVTPGDIKKCDRPNCISAKCRPT
jgi:hypothetical protein